MSRMREQAPAGQGNWRIADFIPCLGVQRSINDLGIGDLSLSNLAQRLILQADAAWDRVAQTAWGTTQA